MRSCPYCAGTEGRFFGERHGSAYRRCLRCQSIYRDMTVTEYEPLHDAAFSDMGFISSTMSGQSNNPDYKTWREFQDLLPPGPFLEIGPGGGHLLAAARDSGRDVVGVEASAVHRDFIVRTWGISSVFASLDDLPKPPTAFSAVVAINTIEHVYDVAALFRSIRPLLQTGGVVLVSTCNAECIILPLVGMYWAMFKPPDHVSIPAAEGLRRLAARTGFVCRRVWTGELPLEAPLGILVALRDRWAERRGAASRVESGSLRDEGRIDRNVPLTRRLAQRAMRLAERVDPSRHITSRLGRAAAIRGLFSAAP